MKRPPEAIIADDESELRMYLARHLKTIWPDLVITGEAKNGIEALDLITALSPDIAFLDIKMPGMTGIDVARKAGDRCRIVFITAFDHYAVEAFESEAVDYLLKPVELNRLQETVRRLKQKLNTPLPSAGAMPALMEKLMERLDGPKPKDWLRWITVQTGESIRLIATNDILYFKASDKYTAVVTAEGESLINKTIRQLTEELDPEFFWQVHRGTIVNVNHIDRLSRSLTGRYVIRINGADELLTVSRTYAHRFRQM